MFDFIITFRETLEAALVVGIVMSYLSKSGNKKWFATVYWAIFAGIILSVVAGYLFEVFLGGFEGIVEEVFEGIIMLVAAAMISWMIVWMLKQRHVISRHIKEKVDQHVQTERRFGVFALIFVAVLREGIETVLFLKASALQSGSNNFLLALLGIAVAVVIGYLLFSGLKKLSLRKFFTVSSILLILFAAGLVAHGVHELQEAGWIPVVVEELWDLNPEVLEEGVYPLWHEKGAIGGLFKGVFGWNGNPSLIEVLSYFVYLGLFLFVSKQYNRREIING